jgi:Protein of unknown function (DUF1592)/Protein of unknown function (DUF1588)/Protein of unknown function (DUF1587)/Protein of unknown function (DUF1585)/Protein of unknown function (DUF1595)
MSRRYGFTSLVLLLATRAVSFAAADAAEQDLERRFTATVRPFLTTYCEGCHGGAKPTAQLDLRQYTTLASIAQDYQRWTLLREKLATKAMPPAALPQPSPEARQQIVDWINAALKHEAAKNAGDPGVVLARRLSNAEYDYTIRDLTGVDIRPAKEFPVDPANPAGFDNSGESLDMSPALLDKYLHAAREVADHMVLKPDGIAFAPRLALAETDRDEYCIQQILDFYHGQDTDYADYFLAAWQFQHRTALGKPNTTLAQFAAAGKVSPKYLATVWRALEQPGEDVGPLARLQSMWRALPAPNGNQPNLARGGAVEMGDFVVQLRKKLDTRFTDLAIPGISRTAQPFLMYRNRLYASNRTSYNRAALQVEGEWKPEAEPVPKKKAMTDQADADEGNVSAAPLKANVPDADLHVPAGQRARYEAAFARFAAVFPDAFYISERGRYFPDNTRDTGRHLSAGFHNLMGYFRDDQPLYEMLLDDEGREQLDELWRELDFIASANIRTYTQFYLFESKEAANGPEGGGVIPDKEITSEARIRKVEADYLAKAGPSKNEIAIKAIEDHFDSVNASILFVEKARTEAEPRQLEALLQFAARAYRRPLTQSERAGLIAFYHSLREKDGLSHEDAMRDSVVSVLMSPDFCYRIDLVAAAGARALSDYALASRLSYFLWSSMPDAELLSRAAARDLHRPEVLAAQARRMLHDDRVQDFATEFGGNWLDFRRFEEHNAVDRERFPAFNNDLREAMFQEPVRYILDVVRNNRSVLDFVFGNYTFVNPVLAQHYGMPAVAGGADHWVRVDNARDYGRGGLIPMAVFLTKNAPGLRTSPVKRGYWVVRRVLGEVIPPPPAVVPELPRDEAKMDLPLRDMLARHRADPSCAACHSRFDSFGLALEGYGPVGEKRAKDLADRPVDARAAFPDGTEGAGYEAIVEYIRNRRQSDFVDSLCRKVLVYALGRSLILSDEPTIDAMRVKLAANNYRFDALIESVVTSPQFLTKRGKEVQTTKGD